MKNNVLIMIGNPTTGKTTISRIMAQLLKKKTGRTSSVIEHYLAATMAPALYGLFLKHVGLISGYTPIDGDPFYTEAKVAAEDAAMTFVTGGISVQKEGSVRRVLVSLGDLLTKEQPDFLCRKLYEAGVVIFDGVRRKSELEAFKKFLTEKGDVPHVVYIKREGAAPIKDNMELTEDDADVILENIDGAPNGHPIPFWAEKLESGEMTDPAKGASDLYEAIISRNEFEYANVKLTINNN